MILVVTGSRDADPIEVGCVLSELFEEEYTHIYVGDATGADAAAESWARVIDMPVTIFKARWREHGKSAGPRRNREMLDAAVATGQPVKVLAFPRKDKPNKGTMNCIQEAIKRGLNVDIHVVM